MFLCRETELEELNRRYRRDSFECMIIYGRRRVGKTALINEFCKDKPTIYFPALKDTAQGNLEALSAAIRSFSDPESTASLRYESFQDAFQEIGRLCEKERIVVVIDEYPYLAKSDPSVSSRLQHLIDLDWEKGKMFLIKRIGGRDETRKRLAELGLVSGEAVSIISAQGGDLILNVKGSRLALTREMAQHIMV